MSDGCDRDQVRELLELIRAQGLLRPPDFDRASLDTLTRVYNGIGPEAWPERYREWVSRALIRYAPEALIHDFEYVFQPKTYLAFTAANLRFACNSIVKAWHDHRVAGKLFWADAGCGVACALLCQLGGWQAFKIGKIPNKQQEDV